MVRFGFFWSFLSELQRSHVAQRAVGTDVIVLPSPVFDNKRGPGKSPELFAIQALFPKAGVEALQVSILPWASRLDLEVDLGCLIIARGYRWYHGRAGRAVGLRFLEFACYRMSIKRFLG